MKKRKKIQIANEKKDVKDNLKDVIKDNSPYVFQREKINFSLNIKGLNWTDNQKKFIDLALNKETKVLFVKGPAGSSKTFMAMFSALKLLNDKKVSDIILVRSAVESADSKLGYLPGGIDEKFNVYITPFHDKLKELISSNETTKLEKDERLQVCPINFARGLHWAAKCIVCDEAQNFTTNELKTLLTRIGMFSKVFICGDPSQSDLTNGKSESFEKIYNLFDSEDSKKEGIFTFEFKEEDIVRSNLVRFIVKKFIQFSSVKK